VVKNSARSTAGLRVVGVDGRLEQRELGSLLMEMAAFCNDAVHPAHVEGAGPD